MAISPELSFSLEVPDPAEIAPISFENDWTVKLRNVNAEPLHNACLPPALCILPDSCNIYKLNQLNRCPCALSLLPDDAHYKEIESIITIGGELPQVT
jgi:hypothetical protein